MKMSDDIILGNVLRLRNAARKAGCVGLLAIIDSYTKEAREEPDLVDFLTPESDDIAPHPGSDGAWEEMVRRLETQYPEEEEDDADDDECGSARANIVRMLEIIPTLPSDVRFPIDWVLGVLAEAQRPQPVGFV